MGSKACPVRPSIKPCRQARPGMRGPVPGTSRARSGPSIAFVDAVELDAETSRLPVTTKRMMRGSMFMTVAAMELVSTCSTVTQLAMKMLSKYHLGKFRSSSSPM